MGRDTVLVELDEGPAEEPVGAADDLAPGGRQRGRPRWRRWLAASAVVAVVLGGLGGVQFVVDARQRAAWDELAAQSDAVLRPLSPTLTVTPEADLPLELGTSATYGDTLVGLVGAADGSLDAVAVGLDTWQVRWRQTLIGPTAGLAEGETRWATGACQRVSDEAVVVCLIDDLLVVEREVDGMLSTEMVQAATVYRLLVLDPRTGAVLVDQELAGEVLGSPALLPGLAVVAVVDDAADPEARVDLVGVGLDDGVQRWRTTTQAVVDMTVGPYTQLETVGSSVAFATTPLGSDDRETTTSASVTFVGADGVLQRTVSGLAFMAWSFFASGDTTSVIVSDGTTTVLSADGNDVTLPAGATTATIDDGSLGMLWFAAGAAYDGTGTLLWRAPAGTGDNSRVVLRGTVYLVAYDQVVAIDGATGKELWRTEPTGETVRDLLTDGSVLAAVIGPDGVPSRLVAFDLRDGRRQWDADLPADFAALYCTRHTLVGWRSSDGLGYVLR